MILFSLSRCAGAHPSAHLARVASGSRMRFRVRAWGTKAKSGMASARCPASKHRNTSSAPVDFSGFVSLVYGLARHIDWQSGSWTALHVNLQKSIVSIAAMKIS